MIVNYNTKYLLFDCLASIYNKTEGLSFEVIVVDNASTDNSESFICGKFPQVKWISSCKNLGFGNANNLGVCYAIGKYVLLLNSDTILVNNAVGLFYSYAINHKKEMIGALGSWLLDDKKNLNKSYGLFPCVKNEILYLLKKYKYHIVEDLNVYKDVDFISGADLFLERKLFNNIGGFDKNIFMYYEETDLQYRMKKLGLIRRVIPGPKIIHLEGGSFEHNGLSLKRFVMAQTSYNYYMKKNFHGVKYIYSRFMICFIRLTIFFTTNWKLSEKIKAYKLVLSGKIK